MTLAEIEELWGKLIGDTNVLYSDMIQKLIYSINEKDVVRKKNEYKERGIILKNNRNASRTITTLHGKVTYSRNILVPVDMESKKKLQIQWEICFEKSSCSVSRRKPSSTLESGQSLFISPILVLIPTAIDVQKGITVFPEKLYSSKKVRIAIGS